jgi:hypothetical protein
MLHTGVKNRTNFFSIVSCERKTSHFIQYVLPLQNLLMSERSSLSPSPVSLTGRLFRLVVAHLPPFVRGAAGLTFRTVRSDGACGMPASNVTAEASTLRKLSPILRSLFGVLQFMHRSPQGPRYILVFFRSLLVHFHLVEMPCKLK